ncbi:MAG TPA: heparinase II/III family protein [Phycisphaerae bacterium]|nr:heparinase II/III family protein [Phycisphaerae bacterium]HOM50683.1 heparinase II/III family protein [Phycisphaerae bacterium]HOQ85105.1 heparinase II/III family protein [Phycisphaerae bacterium]HPP26133.1 heparinase II/III family protein [Phycisphaerae bacterium]HPU26572.1 heparinase II/III family protein [Phycisphaerae bacterium]
MACGRAWRTGLGWLALCALPATAWAVSGDVPVGGADLKIAPPLPVWPSDYETITEHRPAFRLNGRYQATRYRVELARDANFTSPITLTARVVIDSGITPVAVAPYTGEPLADGQYFWRAFAGDDDGFWTPPANYRTFFVASEPDRIRVPAEVVHPRLILSERERDAFKKRVETSLRLSPGWQYIQNAALSALEAVPPDEDYARAAKVQHGNYSIAATWYHRHLSDVAFVAFVTGDERLAAKGVEMLMAACAYERWLGPSFLDTAHFDPPWNSALETAMMTTAVATGYDLLYPYLTDEQRARVREALVEKGIRPLITDWADPVTASRLPRHQLPTGNWVMVCSTSAGVGALALLGEHPEAPEWVRIVRNRVRAWLRDRGGDWFVDNPWVHDRPTPIPVIGPSEPNFGIDSGYKESIGYMNYAMQYVCCFADGLRRMTGENLFLEVPPKLLDHAAWSILAWPEDGQVRQSLVPFGDCGTTAAFPLLYAALTRHRRDPLAAWLAERVVPVPQDIRSLVWLDESVPGSPPDTAVPLAVFRGIGHVVLRSGWGPDTPAAAIKFHQNRGHLDIGTFYLFGGGHPTLTDSVTAPYSSAIYREYSSQSVAHNLVLVDGQPQTRADGKLLAAVGTSRIAAASGQLAAAYPGVLNSWTRDLVMLPGNVAIVFDRLAASEPHRFDLVLHPYVPFRFPHPTASPGELLIGDGPDATRVCVYSEAEITVSEQDGYYGTTPRKYVRFNSPEPARNRTYLMLCEWPPGRSERPQRLEVDAVRPGRWQIRSVGENWRLLLRTGAEATPADTTDARLVAVWDQGEKSRERHALVLGGRRLGVDNREIMRATRPVHAAIEFGRPLWAHFWAAEPTRVALAAEPGSDYVFINGQPADVARGANSVSFDLPAGQSTVTMGEASRFIPRPPALVSDDLLAVSTSVNAPAFRPGVIARASSFVPEPLLAIDGDANTGWTALPGLPLPQWMEVQLPEPVRISSLRIEPAGACSGHVELWDRDSKEFVNSGAFETTPERASVRLTVEPRETDRIRVTITQVAPGASAGINTLDWSEP